MSGGGPVGQFRRMVSVVRQKGVGGFVASGVERLRERLGFPSEARLAYRRHKEQVDSSFDSMHGVETGGVDYLGNLTIKGQNAQLGTNHIASDPGEFGAAMAAIDIDLAGATFIDFGAGKGRALMLAADYPFAAIIGIEFALELWKAGQANLAKMKDRLPDSGRIALQLADATEYKLPAGPLILYLYNPFDAPIVGAVARRAMDNWKADPRPMRVAYLNPLHLAEWTQAGWQVIDRQMGHALLAPAV